MTAEPTMLRFTDRMPMTLPFLLDRPGDSRFGAHVDKPTPSNPSEVSLLLSICGYTVHYGAVLRVRGSIGKWLRVRWPQPDETLRDFLRCLAAMDPPSRWMNPDDERFDVVFGRR